MMAATDPTDDFIKQPKQVVDFSTSDSIFFVRARAREVIETTTAEKMAARTAMDRLLELHTVQGSKDQKKGRKSKRPSWCNRWVNSATGFVFEEADGLLKIMTAAHLIDAVFETQPIETRDCTLLNQAFTFDVMCVHQERELVQNCPDNERVPALPRYHAEAHAAAISSSLDLLVLHVRAENIPIRGDANGEDACPYEHKVLPIATSAPKSSDPLMIRGWPEYGHDSVIWVNASYGTRPRDCITSLSSFGYSMNILELPGARLVKGWSGGPVINTKQQAAAVYHAVDDHKGLAVCLDDIQRFLEKHVI